MARRWISRLALKHEPCLRKVAEDSQDAEGIRELLGIKPRSGLIATKRAAALLKTTLAQWEGAGEGMDTPLTRNIQKLVRLADLTALERELLTFAAILHNVRELREVGGVAFISNNIQGANIMAAVVGAEPVEVKRAMSRSGTLRETGLLVVTDGMADLSDKLSLRDGLGETLLDEEATQQDLLRHFFGQAGESELRAVDFQHMADELRLITGYLDGACRRRLAGVNLLLYGPPGTGKSEFAKVIARAVGKPLYVVNSEDEEGDSAGHLKRLTSYRLCQRFLQQGGTGLVLFDEVEDIFPPHEYENHRLSKAWINRLLETNAVPTIWICNVISQMDKAYLRRFDYSVRFRAPSVQARERMLHTHLAGLGIDVGTVKQWATHQAWTGAQVERAAKVAHVVRTPGNAAEHTVRRVLTRGAELMGQTTDDGKRIKVGPDFDLSLINVDIDLKQLMVALQSGPVPLSMCFYGPSGTGKTSLATYIAKKLERPLLNYRASDLLSPWVGITESQIRDMFESAEREQAVLFLDEADGLFADRRHAKQSWEVTQVNELLSRMETFQGLLICATNLMGLLDEASFRRFTVKARFDYMTMKQKASLLRSEFPDANDAEWRRCLQQLSAMEHLTIGDVAAVKRRAGLFPITFSPTAFVEQLQSECGFKSHQFKQKVGFV